MANDEKGQRKRILVRFNFKAALGEFKEEWRTDTSSKEDT